MLYEFVVEPCLLNEVARSRRNYRQFLELFSLGAPQVISDYPKLKNIRKQVFRLQPDGVHESEKQRLEELVRFLSETPRVKRESEYDGSDWLKSVESENVRVAFDHVVSALNHGALPTLRLEQLFDGEITYPNQLLVKRVASDMAAAVANILRLATTIVFVDPYFNTQPTKWQPLIHFLNTALARRPGPAPTLEVLFSGDKANMATPAFLKAKLIAEEPVLVTRCNVTFKSIRELANGEKLHNRYVLTDIGGVSFGIGLDEGSEHHRDDVALLNEIIYRLRWHQYAEMNGFEVVSQAST
ncbi:hypothetical protein [Pseudomonas sp. TMB3-21]